MIVQSIDSRHRRDLILTLECEHCGHVQKRVSGYDDRNYHEKVVPTLVCPFCGRIQETPQPVPVPKYPEGTQL